MNAHSRNNFKWGVNEVLSLQREYQLLKLSIDEIAKKHKRTPNAIMLKLDKEGIENYNTLYTNYYKSSGLSQDTEIQPEPESESDDDSEYEEEEEEQDEEEDDDDSEYKEEEDESEYYGDDDDEDDDPLTKRVAKLETEIKEIIKTLKDLSSKVKA
jgi:hypothetical protein